MKFTAYFLRFTTPLHLGDYKPDSYESTESFLRSDTITAAIISTWAKQGHENWIGDGNTKFAVSSAFPFYGNTNEEVLFFPKLRLPFNLVDKDSSLSKTIKKIAWVDKDIFEIILNGEYISIDIKEKSKGEFLSQQNIPSYFIFKSHSERVSIPRDPSNDSTPFTMERLVFENAGLYFLASGDDLEKIKIALDLLQHEGIGTDRSIGNGFFTWSSKEIELNVPTHSEYSASLGLYCPERKNIKEELDDKASYDLIKRGGWITSFGYQSFEKNSIYMFTEGSVFKKNAGVDGVGNLNLTPKDITLDHTIYRSGKTIFIPVKI